MEWRDSMRPHGENSSSYTEQRLWGPWGAPASGFITPAMVGSDEKIDLENGGLFVGIIVFLRCLEAETTSAVIIQ